MTTRNFLSCCSSSVVVKHKQNPQTQTRPNGYSWAWARSCRKTCVQVPSTWSKSIFPFIAFVTLLFLVPNELQYYRKPTTVGYWKDTIITHLTDNRGPVNGRTGSGTNVTIPTSGLFSSTYCTVSYCTVLYTLVPRLSYHGLSHSHWKPSYLPRRALFTCVVLHIQTFGYSANSIK